MAIFNSYVKLPEGICILLINSDGISDAAHRQGHRALGVWRPDSDALDALCIYGHIQFCTHLYVDVCVLKFCDIHGCFFLRQS